MASHFPFPYNLFQFQLTKQDGKLIGRGASDDKGPVLGWLHALEAFHECGVEVPVNLRFCFEGNFR